MDLAHRIEENLGSAASPAGADGFKAGDPATVVKGVATTAMATVDVCGDASMQA